MQSLVDAGSYNDFDFGYGGLTDAGSLNYITGSSKPFYQAYYPTVGKYQLPLNIATPYFVNKIDNEVACAK